MNAITESAEDSKMSKITTHHSHFGIDKVVKTEKVTHLISNNTTNLKRIALSLGMEVLETHYRIEEITPAGTIVNNNIITGFFMKNENNEFGLIGRYDIDGNWYLQLDNEVYNNHFSPSF